MSAFTIPLAQLQLGILVFLRVSAILMTIPVFEGRNLIFLFKTGLALSISYFLVQTIKLDAAACFANPLSFGIGAVKEVLMGVAIGLSVRLVFAGVQCAGHLVGYQMGFAFANTLDPQTNTQSSIVAQFQHQIALLLFLAINAHHWFIRGIVESFRIINPFACDFNGGVVELLVRMGSGMFVVTAKVATPLMVVLLLTNVALGLVAKTVPQMNVFIVSFPLTIGVGLLFLAFTLPYLADFFVHLFQGVGRDMFLLLRTMGS